MQMAGQECPCGNAHRQMAQPMNRLAPMCFLESLTNEKRIRSSLKDPVHDEGERYFSSTEY
ncbi:hypothetical protein EYF80_010273 [Liparis tanakae]|uniref:Uncharacterized protein n=1 Tax=Liparis tanakae TaxID=230148 RepID=A0A4Z2IN66_9TELE|nr:hypothetical protein EYF80_010273 [Liparis tanakae]